MKYSLIKSLVSISSGLNPILLITDLLEISSIISAKPTLFKWFLKSLFSRSLLLLVNSNNYSKIFSYLSFIKISFDNSSEKFKYSLG